MTKWKVLSLFDGVSCARLALERAGVEVSKYWASEIDKYAIKVTQANRPDTVQLGSVVDLDVSSFTEIDLLIGGSPCQDLSIAKKDRKGLDGERSGLFWEYVRILNEVKPKYFILENVASMPKTAKATITEALFGIEPVMINASLVSAQNRKRLFWVGKLVGNVYEQVHIEQPEDRGILLKDILENGDVDRLKSYCIDANYWKGASIDHYFKKGVRQLVFSSKKRRTAIKVLDEKSETLTSSYRGTPDGDGRMGVVEKDKVRKLTPIECERLQSMPDNWTNPTGDISNTQRYKMCGNAFNVEVVTHIIKTIIQRENK
jgi:DNA-cytosine methyltransferase